MHFACIVETIDGNFYEGENVENASFGGTICAERNAINSAVSHGERKFKALYLMGDNEDKLCYPCDICKQTFLEFFDKDVLILLFFVVVTRLFESRPVRNSSRSPHAQVFPFKGMGGQKNSHPCGQEFL